MADKSLVDVAGSIDMAEKTATKVDPPIPDKDKNSDVEQEELPSTNSDTDDVKPIICPNCKFVIPPAGSASAAKKRVQPPWWSNEVEDAIEKKRKALKVSNRTGRASDLLTYKKANAFARYTVRNAKAKYQESLQDSEPSKEQNDSEDQSDKTGGVSANGGEGENKHVAESMNKPEEIVVKVEPPDKDSNIENEPNDYELEKEKLDSDSDKESASASVKA